MLRSMEIDRNGLEVLDRSMCLRLVAGARIGRVGISTAGAPDVLPVSFRLVDDEVVFRTGPGTKLAAATEQNVVTFEVDSMDPTSHDGWSVIITGPARAVTDLAARAVLDRAGIPRWAPGGDDGIVAIRVATVDGRRMVRRATPEAVAS
jgi:nitroimidazol reductase NimA-like FMN-containing flavoprotein (pyridoxamine 5'-phosphate oxidase superfamily)